MTCPAAATEYFYTIVFIRFNDSSFRLYKIVIIENSMYIHSGEPLEIAETRSKAGLDADIRTVDIAQ